MANAHILILYTLLMGEGMCIWYHCSKDDTDCKCDPSATVCETSLIIDTSLVMVDIEAKAMVFPKQNQLFKFDGSNVAVPLRNVISADGWYNTSRMVVVANGTMPGPPLIVYEGQQLIINVVNKLPSEQVTIHWHGLPQKGWEYMDGVPFLSQCPIQSGESFLYNFTATPRGTYWYHSHMGNQRGKGLFGALVIRERNPMVTLDEHILTIIEWNHDWDADVDGARRDQVRFGEGDPVQKYYQSGLINGRGRYDDNEAPLEVFTVTSGQRYRFRMIGTGMMHPWEVSIDQHRLTVIASDGIDIEHVIVDSIIINPGERYDFILNATEPVDRYRIRGRMLSEEGTYDTIIAHSKLNYTGASPNDPTSVEKSCTQEDNCIVFNCPFLYFPATENKQCLTYKDIKGADKNIPSRINNTKNFQEFFLNFGFPGNDGFSPPSINGRQFVFPTVSGLADPQHVDHVCDDANCGEQKICTCAHSILLKPNYTVQVVLVNMGTGSFGANHPIHMHGHTYHIVKVGFGTYNESTGKLTSQNTDINCQGDTTKDESFCNNPTWSDPSWLNGNVPGLDLKNPVGKDTIILPSGGYVVLRIIADNPGVWFMHCHIDVHAIGGMALMINESFPNQPPPPQGFPTCHSFPTDASSQSATTKLGVDGEYN